MFYKDSNYKDFPSITISEIDKSNYFKVASEEYNPSKTFCVVGFASYGEYEKPILITNRTKKKLFLGDNLINYPLGGVLADNILLNNGQLFYFRIKDNSTKATKTINLVEQTKSKIELTVANTDIVLNNNTDIIIEFTINNNVYTLLHSANAGNYSLTTFANNVNLNGFTISVNNNTLIIEKNSITENEKIIINNNTSFFNNFTVTNTQLTNGKINLTMNFKAKYTGSNGNNFSFILERKRELVVSNQYEIYYNFYIYYKNELYLFYKNIDLFDKTSNNYLLKLIEDNNLFELELINFDKYTIEEFNNIHSVYREYDQNNNPIPSVGTIFIQLENGTDNIPTNLATIRQNFINGVDKLNNLSEATFRFLYLAYNFKNDINDKNVYEAYSNLAKTRGDCVLFISSPKDLTANEIQNWANNTFQINNDYVFVITNYGKELDIDNNQIIDVPSIYYLVKNLINLPYNWYPLSQKNYSFISINKIDNIFDEKTTLPIFQSGFNIINPIYKQNDGFYLFGQKTGLRKNSALNRLNTRMALIEFEMELVKVLKEFLFNYNDTDTINEILRQANILKQKYIDNKAFSIIEFIYNENENSQAINDNAFILDVHIVPLKTIEKILLRVTLHESGWNIEELNNK